MKSLLLLFLIIPGLVFGGKGSAGSKTKEAGWVKLNKLFGVEIWKDYNLWDDTDSEVAKRLQLSPESRTTTQSSFRNYPRKGDEILDSRPFCFSLYGRNGAPSMISIIFANKGDVNEYYNTVKPDEKILNVRAEKDRKKWIDNEAKKIEKKLTSLLGKPETDFFGQGSSDTREKVKRWDVKSHSILLASPKYEYASLRIIPTKVANARGAVDKVSDDELRETIKKNVEKRDNGDVVIKEIPMVNQGTKGYCAPATWSRYLSYLDIPADMYLLAMAGSTGVGGGTSQRALVDSVTALVKKYNRRIKIIKKRPLAKYIRSYIDEGTPLMWTLVVNDNHYKEISKRTSERKKVKDWAAWKEQLKPYRQKAKNIKLNWNNGHICIMMGYNNKTKEVAISDSYGKGFEERWITEEEAEAIGSGYFWIISW